MLTEDGLTVKAGVADLPGLLCVVDINLWVSIDPGLEHTNDIFHISDLLCWGHYNADRPREKENYVDKKGGRT